MAFWPKIADRLASVAEEGKIGTMQIVGQGREMVLSLNVEKALRDGYQPLLDAAKGYEKAKREAKVRSLKPRKK